MPNPLIQSCLAKLVVPQSCTKVFGNFTFVVQFAYFCISPNKGEQEESTENNKKGFSYLQQTFEQLLKKLLETF